ncbi:hypothetical protein [Endozoicomonas arenosclerae]|uniref:hypothetical protein n=1 Tax=Endozoicomonas arenosclerae TaxID=1633495 RepID=UPI000782C513|nr:hypothetical protein [Endozoicomonas arenosclerae]
MFFLPLVIMIQWHSLYASASDSHDLSFCHEVLFLTFFTPWVNQYVPVNLAITSNGILSNDSGTLLQGLIAGKTYQASYSEQPDFIQFGGVQSRGSNEGTPPAGRGSPANLEDSDDDDEDEASEVLAAAGGDDRKENNEEDRKAEPEDKKNPYLCWYCQKNRGCWQYSCCGRGLCEGCYKGFGVSPVKCPCCGKNRRPKVRCNLCPPGSELLELDQQGVMAHFHTEHLQQRCQGRINQECQHCNLPIELSLPLQQLLNALLSHCYAFCIFPNCGAVLTAETDNTAHFESSHQGQAECPVSGCPMNQLAHIQPSASHMNSHLQYSCGFCFASFNNQQALQIHLTTHIQSYSCGACQGNAGMSLLMLLVGGNLQQFENAADMADLPLDSEEAVINHWAIAHCQISCPLCSHTQEGCDDVSMQEHIDNGCSRALRLSIPEQEQGGVDPDPENEPEDDPDT